MLAPGLQVLANFRRSITPLVGFNERRANVSITMLGNPKTIVLAAKIEGHNGDSNNQGPTQVTNRSDVSSFISAYRGGNPTAQWWRENLDIEATAVVSEAHHQP